MTLNLVSKSKKLKILFSATKYNLLSDQYFCQVCYTKLMGDSSNDEAIELMKEAFVDIETVRSDQPAHKVEFIEGKRS